jgi:AcrR family transcriptional regulator
MRSVSDSHGQKERTFIETARRAQIVAAAIDTIAELGYGRTSLARIAERVGISKGVIAYHFAGKEDLVKEVADEILSKARGYIGPRIGSESTGRGMLRTYIEANLAFMGEHRNYVLAIAEIARGARDAGGGSLLDASPLEAGTAALMKLLARFQGTGEFRADFDPRVMAEAIRAAIDAVPRRLAQDPGLDIDLYRRDLASLFDLATRHETNLAAGGRRPPG